MQMPKPISTRTHGAIDYVFSGTLIALPLILGWSGRARGLSLGAGFATLATSLMTNYEFGAVRLLPMKAHLSIDAAEASALLSAPRMFGGEENRTAGRVLAVMGAVASAVGALTKTRSKTELRQLAA
jgi:hypothetical protein